MAAVTTSQLSNVGRHPGIKGRVRLRQRPRAARISRGRKNWRNHQAMVVPSFLMSAEALSHGGKP
jgi:hypothetical protein